MLVQEIERELHNELAQQFLDCHFPPGQEFYTHQIESLPADLPSNTTCTQPNLECYTVDAAFDATIFYLPTERRTLADAISDPAVYDAFASFLEDEFRSGNLTADLSAVVGMDFEMITNTASPTPAPRDPDRGISSPGILYIIIVGAGVLLFVIVFLVVQRRQRQSRWSRSTYPERLEDSRPYNKSDVEEGESAAAANSKASSDVAYIEGEEDESMISELLTTQAQIAPVEEETVDPMFIPTTYERDSEESFPEGEFLRIDPNISFETAWGTPSYNAEDSRSYNVNDTVDL